MEIIMPGRHGISGQQWNVCLGTMDKGNAAKLEETRCTCAVAGYMDDGVPGSMTIGQ